MSLRGQNGNFIKAGQPQWPFIKADGSFIKAGQPVAVLSTMAAFSRLWTRPVAAMAVLSIRSAGSVDLGCGWSISYCPAQAVYQRPGRAFLERAGGHFIKPQPQWPLYQSQLATCPLLVDKTAIAATGVPRSLRFHRSETCFGRPVRPLPSAKTTEASAREAVAEALAVARKIVSGSPTGQPPAQNNGARASDGAGASG